MKIILTERQLELLKLIKENEDVINKFKNRFNVITQQLNTLYNKIQFISIGELLNKETDVSELLKSVQGLESSNSAIENDMTKFFNSEGEDVYVEKYESINYDLKMNYYYKNSDKINVISAILMNLERLVDESVDNKYEDVFKDNKDINVG
jgi:hypothetical protein